MSERTVSRALLRIGALTTAALPEFGGATTGALAQVVLEGPWRVDYRRISNKFFLVKAREEPQVQLLFRVPGPVTEDPGHLLPEDQEPGTNTPPVKASAGGGDEALAKTGASVLGLGVLGALLVAFGLGASVFGSRRTA
ncbi:hypothetical protein GCM10022267_03950 [Lentzea roselyniae]|uniref:Gram-positive cocci surface proteins LPxTG domain-containing protein n=1 Tax=Lentzea roselyniae TaxID=531940 RepID=A0ABP6ZZL6_9PSEU